ncbi:MAG: alpha/beta fold hydrolase [Pirellulaceae bacterium]
MAVTADWRSLYPFQSHHRAVGEHRYHYLDEGAGSPLLMVHGNPTWSFYWRNLVTAFRDRHRVVVPDHLGCGLSDKPLDYPYRLENHIDNLVELIDQLDLQNTTLLVHDWGGAIGLGAALRRPERFSRIVLFNTGAFPPDYIPLRILACRIPGLGPLAVRGGNLFARGALTMATEKRERFNKEVCAGMIAPYGSWRDRIAVQRFVEDIPLTKRHPTYDCLKWIEQELPSLGHLPIKLIWGGKDWCFRKSCLARFQRIWPEAESVVYEDAGHYVVEDAIERIIPELESFLATPVASTEVSGDG